MNQFLANENFPLAAVKKLREAGFKVISIIQETPGITDLEVIKRAHAENLIILTFDRDYGELIYKHRLFPPNGIVYFRFLPFYPAEPANFLIKILQEKGIVLSGKFTVIERSGIRQRPLY